MVFRRRRATPPPAPLAEVRPDELPPAYRTPVANAVRAQAQFGDLVLGLPEGPLRDRLISLGERVEAGVVAIWRTASRAASIDRVAATLDPARITDELKQARRSGADPAVVETLQARFASTQRLLNARDDLHARLPLLGARLDTAVVHAAELTLVSPAALDQELVGMSAELDSLVVELDTLNAAMHELS